MTKPPECGGQSHQIGALFEVFPRLGYTAPNARAMAARNFVDVGGRLFHRRPP